MFTIDSFMFPYIWEIENITKSFDKIMFSNFYSFVRRIKWKPFFLPQTTTHLA